MLRCGGNISLLLSHPQIVPQNRVMTRYQAIITQLVFDHALRIRVKGEVVEPVSTEVIVNPSSDDATSQGDTISNEPSPSSVGDDGGGSATGTVASSSTRGKMAPETSRKGTRVDKSKGSNMTGKINNLVTSDLSSLQGGQTFMTLSMQPLPPAFGVTDNLSVFQYCIFPCRSL